MIRAEVDTKLNRLAYYKRVVLENDTAIIGTHNKKTGINGCASFCNDGNIKVFEGNPDGSDDKVMSLYKFVKNYSFGLGNELKIRNFKECDYDEQI